MIIFIFIEVKLMTNMLQMYNMEVHNFKGYIPFIVVIWRRKCQPTPIFFPGISCGQRTLVGYSLWGHRRVRHDLATKQQ